MTEALEQVKLVMNTCPGGAFLESFLAGREFTVLCTGSKEFGVKVYPPVERAFNTKLNERQKILGFENCILICY